MSTLASGPWGRLLYHLESGSVHLQACLCVYDANGAERFYLLSGKEVVDQANIAKLKEHGGLKSPVVDLEDLS